jgi:translation initiation factor 3 subunit G
MTDWADDTDDVPKAANWAEQDDAVPEPTVVDNETGDQRVKTTYKWRENETTGKKELIQLTRTFDLVKTKTSKKVAHRRTWQKFGASKADPPGPQDSTTIIAEEVTMRFIHADQTEEDAEEEDEMMIKIKRQVEYLSFFNAFGKSNTASSGSTMRPTDKPMADPTPGESLKTLAGKYMPPRPRGNFQMDEVPAIRVSNISSAATQEDLQQLFEKFGRINRIHLGRDRRTNESRGFAFINYANRDDAQRAIDSMNGFGYDHLILSVEWSENRKKDAEGNSENKSTGYRRNQSNFRN